MRGPDKSRASPLTRLSGTGGISELADWPTCVRPRGYGAVAGQPRGPSAHARAMTAYPSTYSNTSNTQRNITEHDRRTRQTNKHTIQ